MPLGSAGRARRPPGRSSSTGPVAFRAGPDAFGADRERREGASGAPTKRRSRGTRRMQRTSASDVTPLLRNRPGMTSPSYETSIERSTLVSPSYGSFWLGMCPLALHGMYQGVSPKPTVERRDWRDFGEILESRSLQSMTSSDQRMPYLRGLRRDPRRLTGLLLGS